MDHRSNSISRHNYNDNNNGSYENTNVNQGGGNDGNNNRNASLNPQNSYRGNELQQLLEQNFLAPIIIYSQTYLYFGFTCFYRELSY